VTGYDFLTDSAGATRDLLGNQGVATTALISETWTATDLRNRWTQNPTRQDLASISAHFEHWRAEPASAAAGLFYSSDVSGTTTSPISAVVWSVGCHAGYNVHDAHSASSTSALDFAQAFAWEKTGGFVGNTGYGLGDTTEIAYSEKLMLYFAQELGSQANVPVGKALVRAKQRYVGSAPSGGFSRYDEKVMIEATLYGLPMYQVSVPTPLFIASGLGGTAVGAKTAWLGTPSAVESYEDLAFSFTFDSHAVPGWGTYYTVQGHGDTQASPGRPIQPLVISDVTRSEAAHGVVLMSASYHTTTIDPVIATLVTDTSGTEPTFEYDGWYPMELVAINRLGDGDKLAIVPAQFLSESQTERLYTNLTLRVYYTDSTDYTPPAIWSVESDGWGGTAIFSVDASDDESGIADVWFTYSQGDGQWQTAAMIRNNVSGLWEYTLNLGTAVDVRYVVQVVDGAGNVTYSSNKGLYFAAEAKKLYMPLVFRNGSL
jgi:hypothetical protein